MDDIRFIFSYRVLLMGEMKRSNARENEERQQDRFVSTMLIAAAIICAVRLALTTGPVPSCLPLLPTA